MKIVLDEKEVIEILKNHVSQKLDVAVQEPFVTAKNEDGTVDVFSMIEVLGDGITFEVE